MNLNFWIPHNYLFYSKRKISFLVQVWFRTEVLRTPSSTRPWFENMTSRSWQYTSCHWEPVTTFTMCNSGLTFIYLNFHSVSGTVCTCYNLWFWYSITQPIVSLHKMMTYTNCNHGFILNNVRSSTRLKCTRLSLLACPTRLYWGY